MTRHSKNATAHSTYTYHEKKKDSEKSGYGSRKRRLGAESGYQFDCCCITLQPSEDLLVSKYGVLFDRKAVLEYILEQRNIIDMKMKEYDNQKLRELEDAEKTVADQKAAQMKRFIETNSVGKLTPEESAAEERCFWSNAGQPASKRDKMVQPDTRVRCPVTKEPLRYKDLFSVRLSRCASGDGANAAGANASSTNASGSGAYKCAVTGDILTNATPLVALRSSGAVITAAAFANLVKQSMLDPINGRQLRDGDVVFLRRGASSFAQIGGDQLVSQVSAPVMQC